MSDSTIVVAGATGDLGGRIARALLERGASVRALVRHGTAQERTGRLQQLGVEIAGADLDSASEVRAACAGASCVVSALQGLRDVIVETQTSLLDGAIEAGVPRFIPSFEIARLAAPKETELYPAWQGMQYMRNMFDGRAKLRLLDNDRYPGLRWTPVREVISARQVGF